MMKDFRVCKECDPPHVENCETCFGWGLHPSGSPISYGEVEKVAQTMTEFEMCPECYGNPWNPYIFILWGDSDSPEKPVGILYAGS
jgi:hypothetical protein